MLLSYKEPDETFNRRSNPRINYDFGSDESLPGRSPNPFGINTNYSPFGSSERFPSHQLVQNPYQRRHSSYSHEDILNMKYQQPQIDPRYRDSRPFVNSASNIYEYTAKKDFFARRRSSSSLQDEMVQPFKTFQQKAAGDGILRKSNHTVTTSGGSLSDKSSAASRWDLNPSIFIEEYDDALHSNAAEENRSPSSSTKSLSKPETHEPLNEETVAHFVGNEEIPFIDDDPANMSDESEPIYVPSAMQSNMYVGARKGPPMIKNRKTVSFDLVEKDYENKPRPGDSSMNKSKTCGHITNISLSELPGNRRVSLFSEGTNKPTIKLCSFNSSYKSITPLKSIPLANPVDSSSFVKSNKADDSDDNEAENLSAYFDNDEPPPSLKCATGPRKAIDEAAVALDLTGLVSSDSTTVASPPQQPTPPLAVPETILLEDFVPVPKPRTKKPIEFLPKERKRWQPSAWVPTNLYDRLAFGNGKVQALRSFYESHQRGQQRLTESSPDLRRKSNKLTVDEQQRVMLQLREWSDFGSRPVDLSRSVDNIDQSRDEPCVTCHQLTAHQSEPNIDMECRRIVPSSSRQKPKHHAKFPNAYLIRSRGDSCAENRLAKLEESSGLSASVPELFEKPTRTVFVPSDPKLVYGSPSGGSKFLTLRKIKHAQSRKKAHASKCAAGDASDEPR